MTRHTDATVAWAIGEARPTGIAKHSVTTALVPRERVQQRTARSSAVDAVGRLAEKSPASWCRKEECHDRVRHRSVLWWSWASWDPKGSDIAVSFGEAGPSWPKANGRNSTATTTAFLSAGKARAPEFDKHCTTTESKVAVSLCEAGLSWP